MGIRFRAISVGKMRRYFSFANFLDVFKIPLGVLQAMRHISNFKPDVIFSKGGYVAMPVVVAGWILRRRIVIHESDFTPGMATKISALFAEKICVPHARTKGKFPKKLRDKVVVTGNPVREEIVKGSKKNALKFLGVKEIKNPVLLVMGGSTGALSLNEMIWGNAEKLLGKFTVIHITGKGKGRRLRKKNYFAFEYVDKELKDIYALTDIVACRSGAGTVSEVNALGLPAVYVPLSSGASRGDQLENAKYMSETQHIILDEKIGNAEFVKSIMDFYEKNRRKKRRKQNVSLAAKKIVLELMNSVKLGQR